MSFREDVRAACVTLLDGYATANSIKLQTYRARPRSITPPSAFVDRIRETTEYVGVTLFQRRPIAEIVVVHRIYDGGEAADQADAFVDGFLAYVANNVHEGGANTTIAITGYEDEPNYVADWIAPDNRTVNQYYATRFELEGFAEEG